MTETWRDVPGWEGFYAVSDAGSVKALARTVQGRPNALIRRKERPLGQRTTRDGYKTVALSRDGRKVEMRVHRLVLMAFVGPCPDGMEACHNDGDKAHNALVNLRWDTRSANTYDRVAHGSHHSARKTHCPQGHPYSGDNVYIAGHSRRCRTCVNTRKRLARAQLKENAA